MDAQQSQARAGGSGRRRDDARSEARVAAMLAAHGDALRRMARRYSASTDDAEDAVQRALEIYIRRLARLDPATEDKWLKVVVKHEALALRRARAEALAGEPLDPDAEAAPDQRPLEDLLAGRERAGRVAEALRRIKPDEARALLLKADGLSYREIGERMGWSYTKVNRCLTEGRRRFLAVYAEIEAGEACERVAPALADLAGGVADAEMLLELRPHLRHCPSCRAKVRRLHAGGRARAVAYAPLAWLHGIALRLAGADAATGAQVAVVAGGGGGRLATVAAVAGLCLGGPVGACLAPSPGVGADRPPGSADRPPGSADRPAESAAAPEPPRTTPAARTVETRPAESAPARARAVAVLARPAPPAPARPRRGEFGFELAARSHRARSGGASEFAAMPEAARDDGRAARRAPRRDARGGGGASEPGAAPEVARGDARSASANASRASGEFGFEPAPRLAAGDP